MPSYRSRFNPFSTAGEVGAKVVQPKPPLIEEPSHQPREGKDTGKLVPPTTASP